LNRRLGGPWSRPGRFAKNRKSLAPAKVGTQTVQP